VALARTVAYFMPLVAQGGLGHHDTGSVLPYMLRYFHSGRSALLIDIGANLGDTSATLVRMFTDADCVRYQARKPPQGMHEDCNAALPVRVFAYEPVPENYALLAERAAHDMWPAVGWRGFQVALTSPAAIDALPALPSGARHITFYGRLVNGAMVGGDQQGGLGPTGGTSASEFINVEGWTLDGHLASIGEGETEVLLLKVDTEGFDGQTLLGAGGTLRAGRVAFLVFEYNDKWSASGDSIKPVSQWLQGLGYECYWITEQRLVPLSGRLWHDGYEFRAWSNVFCHRASDARAASLVAFYNGDARPVCSA
jgi:FkbM family methyltransferase